MYTFIDAISETPPLYKHKPTFKIMIYLRQDVRYKIIEGNLSCFTHDRKNGIHIMNSNNNQIGKNSLYDA